MNKYLAFLFTALILVSCNKDTTAKVDTHEHKESKFYYTCSMHPKVKQDKPGKCPICHMNLTKVEVDDEGEDGSNTAVIEPKKWRCENFPEVTSEVEELCPLDGTPMIPVKSRKAQEVVGKVKLRKAQLQHFKPAYFPVTTMKMVKKVRLLGAVMQSEEKEGSLSARIGGRVEKVYVKSTGSFIRAGDPVVDIYSPKLITAGEEYLIARQSYEKQRTKDFADLLKQSEERLKLWGIKKSQYEVWFKTKKVPTEITIYSDLSGIVRNRFASVGKYFKEGQNYFSVADLSSVWVEIDVYEQDSALIEMGQKVELKFTALPGKSVAGEIDFINPVLDEKSRTLKIRTTIENKDGKLKPGMIANATISLELKGQPLVIPRTAVIDTGKRKVVWVKITDKQFQAKKIETGFESEGYVEVSHGLMEGENIVIDGNFLLDAQAQLFGGYEEMESQNTGKHQH